MSDKEARIRIAIDNAASALSELQRIQGEFRALAGVLGEVKKQAIDSGNAVTQIKGPPSAGQMTDKAEDLRLKFTRLSIAATGSADSTEIFWRSAARAGERLGVTTEKVAEAQEEYGRLTGELVNSAGAIEDLGKAGNNAGRPLSEMIRLGADLHNNLGVRSDELGDSLAQLDGIARRASTPVAVFRQTISELSPELEKFDHGTEKSRLGLVAFVAAMGKGLPPQRAKADAAAFLGWISQDAMGLGRLLGHSLYDSTGHLQDPEKTRKELRAYVGRTRNAESQIRAFTSHTTPTAARRAIGLPDNARDSLLGDGGESLGTAGKYLSTEEVDRIRSAISAPPLHVKDELMTSFAGQGLKYDRQRENADNEWGLRILRERDEYKRKHDAKGGQITDLGVNLLDHVDVPFTKGKVNFGDVARVTLGAGGVEATYDYLTGQGGPASVAPSSGEAHLPSVEQKTAADQLQATQETNRILKAQPSEIARHTMPDKNIKSVSDRSTPPQ